MNKDKIIARPTDPPEGPALSSSGYKALALLRKGRAYQVRGHWRLRGFRGCIRERALLALLEKGFAERGVALPYAQVRITDAGRSANRACELAGRLSRLAEIEVKTTREGEPSTYEKRFREASRDAPKLPAFEGRSRGLISTTASK